MRNWWVPALCTLILSLSAAVQSAELVGYWALDEGQGTVAKNSAGSGYDGTIHGAKWVEGRSGPALEFSGNGDYVEIKDEAPNSPFALTSMSLSAWVCPKAYPKSTPVYWAGIVGKAYYGESTYGLSLGPNGQPFFTVYGPFGAGGKVDNFIYSWKHNRTPVSLNQWHYLVVTYDNSSVKFYIDGRLDAVYNETRLPAINRQSILIGATYAGGRYFTGIIEDVKIHKGALTDLEVEAEYKKGGGKLTSSVIPKTGTAPRMDGSLDDTAWKDALKVELVDSSTGRRPKAPTTAYACRDDRNIYIAFDCKEPLINKIKASEKTRNGEIWNDDCVEVFIDPGLTRKSYYQFGINSINTQADKRFEDIATSVSGWSGRWESSARVSSDGWIAEMKIPLSNFQLAPETGGTWGLNLCRERKPEFENTSWAPTSGGFHVPKKFGIIHGLNDLSNYKVALSTPKVFFSLKNKQLSPQYSQTLTNNSGRNRKLRVSISNTDGKDKIESSIELADKASRNIVLPVAIREDSRKYHFLTRITDDISGDVIYLAEQKAECSALMHPYFTRSYYTTEKTARLIGSINIDGPVPPDLSVSLLPKVPGKPDVASTSKISERKFDLQVGIAAIPSGTYDAVVSLKQGGETIYAEKQPLIKNPPADYEVKVDRENLCLLVDGKPFFPIGMFRIPLLRTSEYAAAGFNFIEDGDLDVGYYNGMYVGKDCTHCINRVNYSTKPTAQIEKDLRNSNLVSIAASKTHPAFVGYFWDELMNEGPAAIPGTTVLSRVTRELDPYHPIMPCSWELTGISLPPEIYDVAWGDIYWESYALTSKSCFFLPGIDADVKLCEQSTRKPFWFVPQTAGWKAQSAITPAQQRAQTYLGLIHGARGIVYWNYWVTYPAMRTTLKTLAGEIRDLSPVLLTLSPEQKVAGIKETEVHALAKIYNGACYLLTANNSSDTAKQIRIKVTPSTASRATVLFENRTVPVKDGTIEDQFAPYATHVYRLDGTGYDNRKPLNLAIEKLSSSAVPEEKIRRWPDIDETTDAGKLSFNDEEDGQPRYWWASCGWETPRYCGLDASQTFGNKKSLRLSITPPTRYSPETGHGWSAATSATSFDLGAGRSICRYGHAVSNGTFSTDLPDGKYKVMLTGSASDISLLESGSKRTPEIKTVEVPTPKGIQHPIKEYTFEADVTNGRLDLSIPSGIVYNLTITGQKSASFDFGTEDSPVSSGTVKIAASMLNYMWLVSGTVQSPVIKMQSGKRYKLSVYLKSDTPGLPVKFGMTKDSPWGWKEGPTVNAGTVWKQYTTTISQTSTGYIFIEFNAPGTVWISDFALEELN